MNYLLKTVGIFQNYLDLDQHYLKLDAASVYYKLLYYP